MTRKKYTGTWLELKIEIGKNKNTYLKGKKNLFFSSWFVDRKWKIKLHEWPCSVLENKSNIHFSFDSFMLKKYFLKNNISYWCLSLDIGNVSFCMFPISNIKRFPLGLGRSEVGTVNNSSWHEDMSSEYFPYYLCNFCQLYVPFRLLIYNFRFIIFSLELIIEKVKNPIARSKYCSPNRKRKFQSNLLLIIFFYQNIK